VPSLELETSPTAKTPGCWEAAPPNASCFSSHLCSILRLGQGPLRARPLKSRICRPFPFQHSEILDRLAGLREQFWAKLSRPDAGKVDVYEATRLYPKALPPRHRRLLEDRA